MKTREMELEDYFEMQEFLVGIILVGLEGVELPEEHKDLEEVVQNALKKWKIAN